MSRGRSACQRPLRRRRACRAPGATLLLLAVVVAGSGWVVAWHHQPAKRVHTPHPAAHARQAGVCKCRTCLFQLQPSRMITKHALGAPGDRVHERSYTGN